MTIAGMTVVSCRGTSVAAHEPGELAAETAPLVNSLYNQLVAVFAAPPAEHPCANSELGL
jgi:hypothetical protein